VPFEYDRLEVKTCLPLSVGCEDQDPASGILVFFVHGIQSGIVNIERGSPAPVAETKRPDECKFRVPASAHQLPENVKKVFRQSR
jgi:hypothetical protein